MRVRNGIVLAALAASMTMPAFAQSGWRGIGRAQADPGASSVTITARGDDPYREYMICLEGGAARLLEAQIHYRDNRVQTNRIRARVADGACSRSATVGGRDRTIATIEVGYDPASLQGSRPRIELYVR
ncbi:MAG TPA: hypothetical protein VK614_03985 [Allosphingosinicella sp.]|nr:hypothetical protein [Allosphingosinicella sp.]